jgi:hypothetical protein
VAQAGSSAVVAWQSERRPFGRADVAAALVWTAAVVAFFWDAVSLQGAFFYFDVTEINFPYRDFLAREIRLGRFSRWLPGLYCGMPLYSESQAGYLHPLKYLLYPWLETWQAFNLDTVMSVWLTGLGTYGWLRRHAGPRGALTGAGVFGLGGFVWAHLIHTSMINALASVPLVVWATEWAWDRRRAAGVALGAIALAVQVFAGHLQDTFFTVGMLGLYALFRAATEEGLRARLTVLGAAGGVVALGVALAAVQWVPSKELLDRSPRANGLTYGDLIYGSWAPELLPTLVVREAYGTRARDTDWMDGYYPYHEMNAYFGLTALALAVIGGAAYRDRWVAFWVVLAGIGSLLMLGKFTFLFDHAHEIPVLGSSRIPVRFHVWVSLAVAALAAVGVDRLERGFPVRLRGPALLVGFMVLASIPILLYVYSPILARPKQWNSPYHLAKFRWLGSDLTVGAVRTLVVGVAGAWAVLAAVRARSPRARQAACGALPLIVIADLLGAHWHEMPTITPRYWSDPPLSARRLKSDPSFARLSFLRTFQNEPSAGEKGYASRPVDFLPVRDTLGWSLPPVWGLASIGGETPIIPRRMVGFTDHAWIGSALFDVASVTHFTSSRHNPFQLDNPEPAGTALVYPNPGVLPRARLMGRPHYVADETAAAEALDRLGAAIRERVVVEDPDRPLAPDAAVSGNARITLDQPERVVIETESAAPAYLVLADGYDPGWSATVDGRPAPIRPAWLAFRAVYLPGGRHTVEFRYRPAGFGAGLAISLAGLAVSAVLVAWPRRLPPTAPEHAELAWPDAWPAWFFLLLAGVVAVSAVGLGDGGRPGLNARWKESFHPFTWGAGIEAIRPRPGR